MNETIFVRTESKCKDCPLSERNRVWARGTLNNKIAIFGEAPGSTEDRTEKPFVGPAGQKLDSGLRKASINRRNIWLSNVISCRPPSNDISSIEAQEALKCCMPGLIQELTFLIDNELELIVPLGNFAKERFLGEIGTITKVRGSVYYHALEIVPRAKLLLFMPTYHPSYIMRKGRYKQKSSPISLELTWWADLEKAKKIVTEGWTKPQENFNIYPTINHIEDFFNQAHMNLESVAIDLETAGLNPDTCSIYTRGFARNKVDAVCVPVYDSNFHRFYDELEEETIKSYLSQELTDPSTELIVQNALFDLVILAKKGYGTIKQLTDNLEHDIMLLHHAICPELPHGIDYITSIYGTTPYWKDMARLRDGSLAEMNQETLRTYNLRDCTALHQDLDGLLKDLKEAKTEEVYYNESLKLVKPLAKMKLNGIKLNKTELKKYKTKLQKQTNTLQHKLRTLGNLPDAFSLDSDEDVRYFLFGIRPSKFQKIKELASKKRTDTKVYKDLCELKEVRDGTTCIFKLDGVKLRKTDTGKVSVNDKARLAYMSKLNNRLDTLKKLKKPRDWHAKEKAKITKLITWLETYSQYTSNQTLLERYFNYETWTDGRIHASFSIHGTNTGRFSSREPNLQNLPKKIEGLRRAFEAEKGRTFVTGDYSNLEVRVLAEEADDDVLRKELERNVHDENTKTLFGLTKTDSMWKYARRGAKIFMFGGIQYGGGDVEVHSNVLSEVPQLGLTLAKYREAKAAWMKKHPGYTKWAQSKNDSSRVATTFMGRNRQLMGNANDIYKEKLNMPIQGGAAHIINRAMIRLEDIIEDEYGDEIRTVLQIHDELVYEVPDKHVSAFKKTLKCEMERPVNFYGREVPFPADIAVGPNLQDLKEN